MLFGDHPLGTPLQLLPRGLISSRIAVVRGQLFAYRHVFSFALILAGNQPGWSRRSVPLWHRLPCAKSANRGRSSPGRKQQYFCNSQDENGLKLAAPATLWQAASKSAGRKNCSGRDADSAAVAERAHSLRCRHGAARTLFGPEWKHVISGLNREV
jgi:hypothetical protein